MYVFYMCIYMLHCFFSLLLKIGVDAVGILRVEVTDSGEGIDPSTQIRVFGEFNQFNRNSLQGGGTYLPTYLPNPLVILIALKKAFQFNQLSFFFGFRRLRTGSVDLKENCSHAQSESNIVFCLSVCFFPHLPNYRTIPHRTAPQGFMGFKSAGLGQGSTFYFQLPLYSSATATATAGFAHDSLLLSTPTPSAALTRVVGVMPPLQDKGIPMASDTIKGSMKRRNKVFVVEQDCEVSAVTLCDDDVAAAAAAVTGGAADRVRVDSTDADDPTQHQLTREEKSDEQKKPLPMRRPSTFLPIITSSDHTSLPCSNDTTSVVDEFDALPWGGTVVGRLPLILGTVCDDDDDDCCILGGTGTGSAKHPFLAVTAPMISEEERTRFLLVV